MSTAHQSSRLGFIDSARGVAAFIVLIQHALESSGIIDVHTGPGYSWLNLGQAGVVTFFIISGFIIPLGIEKWGSIKHFAIGRVARIYPLYLSIFAVNILILNAANFHNLSAPMQAKLIGEHLLFLQEYIGKVNCVGASWTLSVEAAWYVMFGFLFAFKLNRKNLLITCTITALLLCLAAFSIIKGSRIPLGRIDLILLCICGLAVYRHHTSSIDTKALYRIIGIITFAVIVGQWTAFGYFKHPDLSGLAIMNSWILGAALFFFFYIKKTSQIANNTTLEKLGKYSYSIYLVHPLLIDIFLKTPLRGWAMVCALIVATLITSLFTYKYIEQPANNWAASMRRKQLASASKATVEQAT